MFAHVFEVSKREFIEKYAAISEQNEDKLEEVFTIFDFYSKGRIDLF